MRLNNGFYFPSASDDGHVNALGGRIETQYSPTWKLRAELAAQWGRRNGADMEGFGFNGRATHALGGAWNDRVHVGYEFLSGDDPDTGRNEAFDPLWGRWPQWSELYGPYTYGMETRTGETTNLHRLNLGWAAQVHPKARTEPGLPRPVRRPEHDAAAPAGFSCATTSGAICSPPGCAPSRTSTSPAICSPSTSWPGDYYVAPRATTRTFLRAELNRAHD
jgi:hypothetical protein